MVTAIIVTSVNRKCLLLCDAASRPIDGSIKFSEKKICSAH